MELPVKLQALVDGLGNIPGVGKKTALRQALSLANWDKSELLEFAKSISGVVDLQRCGRCGLYAESDCCSICMDPHRSKEKAICVVETFSDCIAIEHSGQFRGKYHVLGGVLNPLLGIGPEELNISHFLQRIAEEEVELVILAVNPSVEGDATCSYLKSKLPFSLEVDRIGFGIPMGGSLEHLDILTIGKALENRRKM